jgi:hypothetical protein
MPQKIRNAVARFEEELKVRKERLVARLGGRPTSEWDALDLAELLDAYSRVKSGAVPVDVEFPPPVAVVAPVTLPAVTSDADDPGPAAVAEAPTDVEALPEDPAARLQMMFDLFIAAGIGTTPAERQKRLRIITRCLTLPKPLGSVNDLTTEQVGELVTFMARRRAEGDLSSTLEQMGEVKLPDPPADPVGD